jgi:putative lipoprotein (rSAM/lipoprotein system)
MIKLSEKSRKILRAVYRGLGTATVSLSVSACPFFLAGMYGMPAEYGMPPDYYEEIAICGKVVTKTGEPIQGIGIYIEGITSYYAILTDIIGEFYIYVPKQDNYTIIFTDIDKDKNGGEFKQKTIDLAREDAEILYENPLTVTLERVNED